jgi:hypothetical protein
LRSFRRPYHRTGSSGNVVIAEPEQLQTTIDASSYRSAGRLVHSAADRAYAAAISDGVVLYLRPFNGEGYVDQRPIRRYTETFDRLVLLDRNSAYPAWTISVAYVATFAYRLQLTYRLLRRRLQPSPSTRRPTRRRTPCCRSARRGFTRT